MVSRKLQEINNSIQTVLEMTHWQVTNQPQLLEKSLEGVMLDLCFTFGSESLRKDFGLVSPSVYFQSHLQGTKGWTVSLPETIRRRYACIRFD